jgi:glycosyltransferase involved in cell wall biosynthesis
LYLIDSLAGGGAERSLAALSPHLAPRGVQLEVAYLHERQGVQGAFEAAGVRLHPLGGSAGRFDLVRRTRRLVGDVRPDLVHTTLFEADVSGRIAGALARVPVVSSLVNVAYSDTQLKDPRLRPWKVRAAQVVDGATARLVARFHAISGHVASEMCRRLWIPRARVEVVPRGRDASSLGVRSDARRTAARRDLGLDDAEPMLLAAARQEFQKGLDVLLHALPEVLGRIPRARLLVAGREGNETSTLQALVDRLGLAARVSFLGARSDVAELMCAADAFVFPSRWEGLGSVLLEAMALEVPIVASDLPPVREVLGGDRGALLVPSDDPAALSDALVRALADQAATAERVGYSRGRFVERYTIERVADATVAFYEHALGDGRKRT